MALTQKNLSFRFLNNTGSFTGGPTPNNLLQFGGLRASAKIVQPGKIPAGQAQISIYGMRFDHMNALSTLGQQIQKVLKNEVTIIASDSSNTTASIVFGGVITSAYADMQSSAQVPFRLLAITAATDAVVAIPSTGAKGTQDVIPLLKNLATTMGLFFENNSGLAVPITDQYYWGSALFQVSQACKAADLDWVIEKNTLAVWPHNKTRVTTLAGPITLTPRDGSLLGYPSYTASGIKLRALFNPNITFGSSFFVSDSILPGANGGPWTIYSIEYDLDTRLPNGKWEMLIECFNPALTGTPPIAS